MTLEALEKFSKFGFEEIDKEKVVDISNITINQISTKEEKILEFLEMTENPYFVRCGNILVKMNFANTGLRIDECFQRYLSQCLDERL